MKVLCDTHALLWAIRAPHLLSTKARDVLEDPAVVLTASSVSAFEIATKAQIGKLPDVDFLVHDYAGFLVRLGAATLPLRDDHAMLAGSLRWSHRDPFDRLLAAQSMLEQAPLVTGDDVFATLPGLSTIW